MTGRFPSDTVYGGIYRFSLIYSNQCLVKASVPGLLPQWYGVKECIDFNMFAE